MRIPGLGLFLIRRCRYHARPASGRIAADARNGRTRMSQYPIAVVVGSLRHDSFNRKLATALARLAPSEFSFEQLRIDDLPLYNQDADGTPAESVKRLKREITAARAVLSVPPDYHRTIPRHLKHRSEVPHVGRSETVLVDI